VGHGEGRLAAPFLFGDGAVPHQLVEGDRQLLGGLRRKASELFDRRRPAENRQQLHDRQSPGLQRGQQRPDALRQVFGDTAQARRREVGALVEQRSDQAESEQRIAPGAGVQPLHESRRGRCLDDRSGQRPEPLVVERSQGQAGEDPVLLEGQQNAVRQRMLRQFPGTGGQHDEHRNVAQVGGEVREGVERRRVGLVDVVEHDDHGSFGGEVLEDDGDPFEECGTGRRRRRQRTPHRGDAAENGGQVFDESAAAPGNLRGREVPQMAVEGLRPQPERRRVAHGVRPGHERRHLVMPAEELPDEPALAHPRLGGEQHAAQLPIPGGGQFIVEHGQFVVPPDDAGAPRPGGPGSTPPSRGRR
jgi:hypothetical protein